MIGLFSNCNAQKRDSIYICFENKTENVRKIKEGLNWYYAFSFSNDYFWEFHPNGKTEIISKSRLNNELVDYDWLKQKYKFHSQLILKCPNIFIVEKINNDSLKITPVKVFEGYY